MGFGTWAESGWDRRLAALSKRRTTKGGATGQQMPVMAFGGGAYLVPGPFELLPTCRDRDDLKHYFLRCPDTYVGR